MLSLSPSTQEKNLYTDKTSEEYNMNRFIDNLVPLLKPISIIRNDRTKDAKAAIRLANQKRAKLHFAPHTNAGGGAGVEALYDPKKPRSKELAQRLVDKASKIMGIPNRGIKDGSKTGAKLIEIAGARSDMDAVLIEYIFHDNPKDVKEFREHYKQLVNETAWEIKRYFGVK